MTTKLDSVLKRELTIGGELYTLTISPEGFLLTIKGHRNGLDIAWADLVGGDAALATALNASLTANIAPRGNLAATPKDSAKSTTRPKIDPASIFLDKSVPAARPRTRGEETPAARSKPPSDKEPAARRKLSGKKEPAARRKPGGKKPPGARPKARGKK
jgi:hypothetical protein